MWIEFIVISANVKSFFDKEVGLSVFRNRLNEKDLILILAHINLF